VIESFSTLDKKQKNKVNMKAIILSAGKGERLLPLTKDRPKICVEFGDGTTLLSRQTERLFRQPDIDETIVGCGHCVEKVEEFVSDVGDRGNISVVYNPFYAVSGPLVTLWAVLNKINDSGFIFMNGDTFYSDMVYSKIGNLFTNCKEGIFLLCSHVEEVDSDDIKVKFKENNKVYEAAKNIVDYDAVSAGLMIVVGEKSSIVFREILEKMSRKEDFLNHNKTWHSFIKDLAEEKVSIEPLWVEKSEWFEVDIHRDFQNLQSILEK